MLKKWIKQRMPYNECHITNELETSVSWESSRKEPSIIMWQGNRNNTSGGTDGWYRFDTLSYSWLKILKFINHIKKLADNNLKNQTKYYARECGLSRVQLFRFGAGHTWHIVAEGNESIKHRLRSGWIQTHNLEVCSTVF